MRIGINGARSFARIHESNLKKQGLLPLTFSDPNDYERVRERDTNSLKNLKGLFPGKQIECNLHHSDGTEEKLYLNHSFGESQIEWFKKGSAMNLFHTNQT